MDWKSVKKLHIEITSQCNAVCPLCRRYSYAGYEVIPSINKSQVWTLDDVKRKLPPEDLKGIEILILNGNFGDFIMHPEPLGILRYFVEHCNLRGPIQIATNGSGRNEKFWEELATIPNIQVLFAIDGLEDTHHLYRRETDFNKIITNAQSFIDAGGDATWIMTVFRHNEHQTDACFEMSKALKFNNFIMRDNSRDKIFAYNRDRTSSYPIRNRVNKKERQLSQYGYPINHLETPDEKYHNHSLSVIAKINEGTYKSIQFVDRPSKQFERSNCRVFGETNEIFISARWLVVPCCHLATHLELGNLSNNFDSITAVINANGSSIDNMSALDKTVKEVYEENQGYQWVADKFDNTPMRVCTSTCGTDGGFAKSFNKRQLIPIEQK
jgi:MoaA/NifB/PqqE/SkfB family radical SAM enzyme